MSNRVSSSGVVSCAKCRMEYHPGEEPDPCLGTLPGVAEACCGHGRPEKGYVFFETGVLMRGFRKIEFHDLRRERREKLETEIIERVVQGIGEPADASAVVT